MKTQIRIVSALFYLISICGFVSEYAPGASRLTTYVQLIFDLTIVAFALFSLKSANKLSLLILFTVLISSTLTFILNDESILINHLNGIREVLIPIFFVIVIQKFMNSKEFIYFKLKFDSFVFFFLGIQIPVTILQFIQYGAGDRVGGTFGSGGSGILTIAIFILMYYILSNKLREKNIFSHIPYYIFFLPIFLNETKISFMLFPVLFIFVYGKMNVKQLSVSIIGSLLFFSLLSIYYSDSNKTVSDPIEQIFDESFLTYYLASDDENLVDVPRFTKFLYAYEILSRDTFSYLFGKDFSLFKNGIQLEVSSFTKSYSWLLIGSRPQLFVWFFQGGVVISSILTFWLIKLLFKAEKGNKRNFRLSLFYFLIVLLIFVYNDAFRYQYFISIFFSSFFILTQLEYFPILYSKSNWKQVDSITKKLKPEWS